MEGFNIARIVMAIMAILVSLTLYLVRIKGYKDLVMEQEGMTLIQKRNYERKVVDGVNIIISWILLLFGVVQTWRLLNYSTLFGTLVTLLAGIIPIVVFGGLISSL